MIPRPRPLPTRFSYRRLGKEVTYAKYNREDHWQRTWGYANAAVYIQRMIGWFDEHLTKSRTICTHPFLSSQVTAAAKQFTR